LKARSVSGLFLTVAHIAFAVNIFWMLFAAGSYRAKAAPTLLSKNDEEAFAK
jgi:hypothetical protein